MRQAWHDRVKLVHEIYPDYGELTLSLESKDHPPSKGESTDEGLRLPVGSSPRTTPAAHPSSGPRPPTRSWRASLGSLGARSTSHRHPNLCHEPLGQDTRWKWICYGGPAPSHWPVGVGPRPLRAGRRESRGLARLTRRRGHARCRGELIYTVVAPRVSATVQPPERRGFPEWRSPAMKSRPAMTRSTLPACAARGSGGLHRRPVKVARADPAAEQPGNPAAPGDPRPRLGRNPARHGENAFMVPPEVTFEDRLVVREPVPQPPQIVEHALGLPPRQPRAVRERRTRRPERPRRQPQPRRRATGPRGGGEGLEFPAASVHLAARRPRRGPWAVRVGGCPSAARVGCPVGRVNEELTGGVQRDRAFEGAIGDAGQRWRCR